MNLERGGPVQNFYMGQGFLPTVKYGEGIYLYDTNNKKYLDASSGPVTCNLGHKNKAVLAAMKKQAEEVCFASYNFFENTPNKALAEKLIKLSGPEFDQAFFVSGGSEAIEAAFKLARQYAISIGEKDRYKILARTPSYHGSTMGAFSASSDPEMEMTFQKLGKILPKVSVPFTYRIPSGYNINTYAEFCADKFEQLIINEGPETILAFIMEPVGGLATGALTAPHFYYSQIRDICTKYGVLLIYDEVMSGAGRTGKFLAAEYWEKVVPDLVVLAKGLCAGYSPLGAVLSPNPLVEKIVNSGGFLHGHTYSSNPLSCAIAEAVLTEITDKKLIYNTEQIGNYLRNGLEQLEKERNIIGDIRGLGLLLAIEIVADKNTKKMFSNELGAVYRLAAIGMEKGILLYTRKTANGVFGEWLMITPPLICTTKDIDDLLELLNETLKTFEQETGLY